MAAKDVIKVDLCSFVEGTAPGLGKRISEVGKPAHAGVAGRDRAPLRAEDEYVSGRMCPAVEVEVQNRTQNPAAGTICRR